MKIVRQIRAEIGRIPRRGPAVVAVLRDHIIASERVSAKRLFPLILLTATVFGQQSAAQRKSIADIAKEANGAVVSIVMSDKKGHPVAQGSGFLISKDGHVVTNYHVIKSGASAVIKLPDGAFFAVDGVLTSDKDQDIAVIKAQGNNFKVLTLGDSDRIQVGDDVVAIGTPLSLESTVSNGIVSGIRRDEKDTFLQITAPISPGSSGGPLFNMAGEVVGITTSHIKGGENLNFAVPINDVKGDISKIKTSEVGAFPDEPEDDMTVAGQQPKVGSEIKPSVESEPSLEETERWLHDFVQTHSDPQGRTEINFQEEPCVAEIVVSGTWRIGDMIAYDRHHVFSLRDINANIQVTKGGVDLGRVDLETRDGTARIMDGLEQSVGSPLPAHPTSPKLVLPVRHALFFLDSPDSAVRVAKALRHAVELCGGKPSAF